MRRVTLVLNTGTAILTHRIRLCGEIGVESGRRRPQQSTVNRNTRPRAGLASSFRSLPGRNLIWPTHR